MSCRERISTVVRSSDVDGAVARQPRPHEERHLVAPAHERLLEEPEAFWRPRAMKSEKPFGSPVRKAIHRSMSTPPKSHAVLVQWWMSPSSMSESRAAPARANRSASPLASITTWARMAWRPSLLSKMAPLTICAPSAIGATAQRVQEELHLVPEHHRPCTRS